MRALYKQGTFIPIDTLLIRTMNPFALINLKQLQLRNRDEALMSNQQTEGFTLLEAMVSLLVLFAMMAGLLPVFMSWRLTTINNTIKTGAIAISQEILDELRQDEDVNAWDSSNTALSVKPSGESIAAIDYGGKTYNASLTFCEVAAYCDANTRHVTLAVSHNNDTIYTIRTVYTSFD